jgi:acyl carrier protein
MDAKKESYFQTLKTILTAKYDVDLDKITPTATLESMGLDSLTAVELAFDIEDNFHVKLEEDRQLMARTLDDMIERILKANPAQAAA